MFVRHIRLESKFQNVVNNHSSIFQSSMTNKLPCHACHIQGHIKMDALTVATKYPSVLQHSRWAPTGNVNDTSACSAWVIYVTGWSWVHMAGLLQWSPVMKEIKQDRWTTHVIVVYTACPSQQHTRETGWPHTTDSELHPMIACTHWCWQHSSTSTDLNFSIFIVGVQNFTLFQIIFHTCISLYNSHLQTIQNKQQVWLVATHISPLLVVLFCGLGKFAGQDGSVGQIIRSNCGSRLRWKCGADLQ